MILNLLYVDSPSPLSPQEQLVFFVVIGVILVIYYLRHIPIFSFLWWHIRTLLMIIFAFFIVGYAKKSIKDWWDE